MLEKIFGKKELCEQFRALGITEGMVLEVHSSLKSLGYVIGGAQTVVDALIETVGFDGTIVMPIQDSSNTEPAFWENPPLRRDLWERIRKETPDFKPDESDIIAMGRIAENLNRRPGSYRSYHPNCAFVAYGKYAKLITHSQSLDYALGEQSPLGALYQLPAYILLIGVGYENCTALHLAEYRSNARPVQMQGGAVNDNGYRKWVKYLDLDIDNEDFEEIGTELEDRKMVRTGKVGDSTCRLLKFGQAVDFATMYFQKKYGH